MEIKRIPAIKLKKTILSRKNVAAYCRVSTQQEIQFHSLEAQREYYETKISSNPQWTFVGIYADQASGRHNLKMKNFQRMMDDCRAGKIDLILVKSISRLGRNTLQFLNVCNELNALNVDVYFEVEKIYIGDPNAVRLLTIYESLYQNESQDKSSAVRWGFKVRFEDGSSGLANIPCYGYRQNEQGKLEPDPDKAKIVRLIYHWRQKGSTLKEISQKLEEFNVKSPRGKPTWGVETIRRILLNEKYRGDVLLQKTYVSDYFTGKQRENKGEYPKYLIKNNHEAIIDLEQILCISEEG